MTTELQKPLESAEKSKLSKIKLAFLYVLIGGLVASALLAIVALLVGDFNAAIGKSFGTIFVFVVHSLFILGLIWSDKNDSIGRSIIPTTILATTLASIVTSTLGLWEIISESVANQSAMLYMLLVGTAFIVSGALKLRIKHQATTGLVYATAGTLVAWTLLLVPWVFEVVERFNPLYFRVVGALTILASTLFIVAIIIRTIALSRSEKLRQERKLAPKESLSGGMLTYYIVVGSITAIIWLVGMFAFIIDSVESSNANRGDVSSLVK